jgi:hypothetical protein
LTPNYAIYNSLKFLILLPTIFLIILLFAIFKIFPEFLPSLGKGNMSVVVVILYLLLGLIMWVIVKIFGARAQNRRYELREAQFNKVLKFFNKGIFHKKGIAFYSGKYGAHISIDLKYFNKQRRITHQGEADYQPESNLGQDISQSVIANYTKNPANRFSKNHGNLGDPILLPQAQFDQKDKTNGNMEDFFKTTQSWREDHMHDDPELFKKIQNILAEDDKQNDLEIMRNIRGSEVVEERKEKNTEFFIGEQVRKIRSGQNHVPRQTKANGTEISEPLLKDFKIHEDSENKEDMEDYKPRSSADLVSPNDEGTRTTSSLTFWLKRPPSLPR